MFVESCYFASIEDRLVKPRIPYTYAIQYTDVTTLDFLGTQGSVGKSKEPFPLKWGTGNDLPTFSYEIKCPLIENQIQGIDQMASWSSWIKNSLKQIQWPERDRRVVAKRNHLLPPIPHLTWIPVCRQFVWWSVAYSIYLLAHSVLCKLLEYLCSRSWRGEITIFIDYIFALVIITYIITFHRLSCLATVDLSLMALRWFLNKWKLTMSFVIAAIQNRSLDRSLRECLGRNK